MILKIILWLVVGTVVTILDQAYQPNENEALVFVLWLFWPFVVAMHMAGLMVLIVRNWGGRMRLWGIQIRKEIRIRKLDKETYTK